MDDPPPNSSSSGLRGRASRMTPALDALGDPDDKPAFPPTRLSSSKPRTPPYLPTRAETVLLIAFPLILIFGALYALLSPQVRNAPYDPILQAHVQDPSLSPSYFARKSNVFNRYFVKVGWAWVTGTFAVFVATHPSFKHREDAALARIRAALRWALVTGWWFLVTQWCFGAPIIDRGFRWTGGRCEIMLDNVMPDRDIPELGGVVSALACKAVGGRWHGGHDISGHVFLLATGIGFLVQEVGWVIFAARGSDERRLVMSDGTERGAAVEKARESRRADAELGIGGKAVSAVVALSTWMLLMTAIYFHTWFEKFTGLATALIGLYAIYMTPRFVPALRSIVGLPGI